MCECARAQLCGGILLLGAYSAIHSGNAPSIEDEESCAVRPATCPPPALDQGKMRVDAARPQPPHFQRHASYSRQGLWKSFSITPNASSSPEIERGSKPAALNRSTPYVVLLGSNLQRTQAAGSVQDEQDRSNRLAYVYLFGELGFVIRIQGLTRNIDSTWRTTMSITSYHDSAFCAFSAAIRFCLGCSAWPSPPSHYAIQTN